MASYYTGEIFEVVGNSVSHNASIGTQVAVFRSRDDESFYYKQIGKTLYDDGTWYIALRDVKRLDSTNKSKDMAAGYKYYRVIKDTPNWDEGAVIQSSGGGQFAVVDELYARDGIPAGYDSMYPQVVEHKDNAQFFERVYPVQSKMSETKYVTKAEAKKVRE